MKILILTSAHPTDDVRVHSKIARGFVEAGHEVVWYGPKVSFFDGQVGSDIQWHLFDSSPGWWGRMRTLLTSARAATTNADVDWIYTPDPDAALVALVLSKVLRAKALFDIHEEFHNGLLRRGIKQPAVANALSSLTLRMIRFVARKSDLTIAVSRTVLDAYSPPGSQRLVVLNTATRAFSGAGSAPRRTDRVTAMHGKAIPTNGSQVVIDALTQLDSDDCPETLFITSGGPGMPAFSRDLSERLQQPALHGKVHLMTGVPHQEMPHVLAGCHLGIIAYGRLLGEASLPNRLFEYMASGCAVVAPDYSGEIVSILREHHCGVSVDCEDATALAAALRALVRDPNHVAAMGQAGKRAFEDYFSWETQRDRLLERMETLR